MRRGRIRHGARLVQRDKRILMSCAISIVLLIGLAAKAGIENRQQEIILNSPISQGEAFSSPDFPRRRSYIRYQVAKSGRTSWLDSIALRFEVHNGVDGEERWRKVAKATLEAREKKPSKSEIDAFQYRVEIGTEIRVPLYETN